MILPPTTLTTQPSPEQLQLAQDAHMYYKVLYSNGVVVGWKLCHLKTPRKCGC